MTVYLGDGTAIVDILTAELDRPKDQTSAETLGLCHL